jgi:hypothetical protein
MTGIQLLSGRRKYPPLGEARECYVLCSNLTLLSLSFRSSSEEADVQCSDGD